MRRELKYWLKRFYRWVLSVGDFIQKFSSIIHVLGTISLLSVGVHDYYNNGLKNRYEKHRDRLIQDSIKLTHKADSCSIELHENYKPIPPN